MNWFEKYVGTRFIDGGRTSDGVDCWGLVRLIYQRELKIELPSYAEISAENLIAVSREITSGKDGEQWTDVEQSAILPFDVVVMRYHGTRRIGHVGLVIAPSKLLHIEDGIDAIIVPFTHFTVKERIACFRRHKDRMIAF